MSKQNENNKLLDLIEEDFDEDHLISDENSKNKSAEANESSKKNELLNGNFQLIAASFHQNTELDSITKIDRTDFFHQVSTNSITLID